MPRWVTPDMLTALGFLGGIIAAAGYALAAYEPWMLWVASLGIAINWYGDSLDGSVARARGIERPRYGFFLDNAVDVVEYAIFSVGIGLSGYIRWELVLAALAAFYAMMLLGLIKSRVTEVFQISFGGMGLTEVRVAFILVNAMIYFIPPAPLVIGGVVTTYPNLVSVFWIAVQVATFVAAAISTVRVLHVEDPPHPRR